MFEQVSVDDGVLLQFNYCAMHNFPSHKVKIKHGPKIYQHIDQCKGQWMIGVMDGIIRELTKCVYISAIDSPLAFNFPKDRFSAKVQRDKVADYNKWRKQMKQMVQSWIDRKAGSTYIIADIEKHKETIEAQIEAVKGHWKHELISQSWMGLCQWIDEQM